MPGIKAGKSPNVEDALTECLQLLSEARLLPDAPAHMQVIEALQKGIIQYIQAIRQKNISQAIQGPQGGGGMPGGPGGPMGGGMPPGGMGGGMPPRQIAPGGGAGMSGFGTPNPDELRRTLAGPAAVHGG